MASERRYSAGDRVRASRLGGREVGVVADRVPDRIDPSPQIPVKFGDGVILSYAPDELEVPCGCMALYCDGWKEDQ